MQTPDYGVLMDTQQAINFELFKRFNKAGIEFAYPTQTVKLSNPEVLRGEAANERYDGEASGEVPTAERRRPVPLPRPRQS